jgi:hypothetical protein
MFSLLPLAEASAARFFLFLWMALNAACVLPAPYSLDADYLRLFEAVAERGN